MTNMFTGEYTHSLDAKGRVIMPAKFREELGESFMLTMGFDGCICVYSNEEWMKFVEKLSNLPELKREARQTLRHFVAKAVQCEVDKQGRILVPQKLREYAGLTKDIVFLGVISKIEIWSKERWEENDVDDMDEIAEKLASFGIDL